MYDTIKMIQNSDLNESCSCVWCSTHTTQLWRHPQLHPLAPPPIPEHTPPLKSKGGAPLGGRTAIGRQLSQQAALKSGSPTRIDLQLHIFNLTLCHSIGSVGHVTYSAHLHQIPEVNMAIFWTAQNMCVFIRQTAVKLIAFIDMTGVPVKRHHRLYWRYIEVIIVSIEIIH